MVNTARAAPTRAFDDRVPVTRPGRPETQRYSGSIVAGPYVIVGLALFLAHASR